MSDRELGVDDDPFIGRSARKHGVSDEDILHAYRNPIVPVRREGDRKYILGTDLIGRPLEIVAVRSYRSDGRMVIHARRATKSFIRMMT